MKLRRFKTDNENIHWRDTGMIKVYNYPPQPRTFSYITRIYEEFEKNNINQREVEGQPIYFHDLSSEQYALAICLSEAQIALSNSLKRDEFLTEI